MLTLPASAETFKKAFLGGDGNIEIATDKDAWQDLVQANGTFNNKVDKIADVKIGVSGTKPVVLGGAGTVKIGLTASAEVINQIHLIWPGDEIDLATTRGLKPAAGEVMVRLLLQGKADASAKGSAPIGPLSATFGVAAGGSIGYERLKMYKDSTLAREILRDTFAGIRLPQQIDQVVEIPAAGEVLVNRFGGYLNLSGQVSYGYSMTGSKEIQVGQLNLDLDYALKLLAGLSAGYKLAGQFELEARAGSRPNFVRFIVRKDRQSEFNFAADFGVDAEVHLKGLPDTSDEFLTKAFGASAESVLKLFGKAQKYTDISELEKAAGKLVKGTIHDLSQSLIGKALDNTTLNEFVTKMLQVVDIYNNIDTRIIHLYEDFIGKIPQLTKTLDLLSKVTTADGLKSISDNDAWELITRLAGPKLYDILLDNDAFKSFASLIKTAKNFLDDGATQAIRDTIQFAKLRVPINDLLSQLKGIKTPDDLKNLADEKLQGLAEKLLGKAFDEIRKSDVGKALNDLHEMIDKVATFKEKYYKMAKEIANRSYSAQFHFAYSRASANKALLDVEVDVSTPEGQALARLAASGDFADLLKGYKSTLVLINQGVFTHSVTSSTHLQVNLFGFGIDGLTKMFQQTDEALEAHDGGLMHIYTTKTQLDERHQHGGEVTASSFLFATVAKALQTEGSAEYLIRTLPKMSVQYDLLKEDDKTKPDELTKMLELAELLDIVKAASLTNQLRDEFPKGLGKVSAKYVIRYDSDAVGSAFQIKDGPKRENLRSFATDTLRNYISTKYTSMPRTNLSSLLGFAYAEPETFELYREGFAIFLNEQISITVPGWFTKGAPMTLQLKQEHKAALDVLYTVEGKFVDRLVKLDAMIDGLRDNPASSGVSSDDLNDCVKDFVGMADKLNFGRENSFFIVFDRLILEGTGGRSPRNCALVLEITPPGGQKVTKVISAAKQLA